MNIFDFTQLPTHNTSYVGYISVNSEEDGRISVSVRSHGNKTGYTELIYLTTEQARDLGIALIEKTKI